MNDTIEGLVSFLQELGHIPFKFYEALTKQPKSLNIAIETLTFLIHNGVSLPVVCYYYCFVVAEAFPDAHLDWEELLTKRLAYNQHFIRERMYRTPTPYEVERAIYDYLPLSCPDEENVVGESAFGPCPFTEPPNIEINMVVVPPMEDLQMVLHQSALFRVIMTNPDDVRLIPGTITFDIEFRDIFDVGANPEIQNTFEFDETDGSLSVLVGDPNVTQFSITARASNCYSETLARVIVCMVKPFVGWDRDPSMVPTEHTPVSTFCSYIDGLPTSILGNKALPVKEVCGKRILITDNPEGLVWVIKECNEVDYLPLEIHPCVDYILYEDYKGDPEGEVKIRMNKTCACVGSFALARSFTYADEDSNNVVAKVYKNFYTSNVSSVIYPTQIDGEGAAVWPLTGGRKPINFTTTNRSLREVTIDGAVYNFPREPDIATNGKWNSFFFHVATVVHENEANECANYTDTLYGETIPFPLPFEGAPVQRRINPDLPFKVYVSDVSFEVADLKFLESARNPAGYFAIDITGSVQPYRFVMIEVDLGCDVFFRTYQRITVGSIINSGTTIIPDNSEIVVRSSVTLTTIDANLDQSDLWTRTLSSDISGVFTTVDGRATLPPGRHRIRTLWQRPFWDDLEDINDVLVGPPGVDIPEIPTVLFEDSLRCIVATFQIDGLVMVPATGQWTSDIQGNLPQGPQISYGQLIVGVHQLSYSFIYQGVPFSKTISLTISATESDPLCEKLSRPIPTTLPAVVIVDDVPAYWCMNHAPLLEDDHIPRNVYDVNYSYAGYNEERSDTADVATGLKNSGWKLKAVGEFAYRHKGLTVYGSGFVPLATNTRPLTTLEKTTCKVGFGVELLTDPDRTLGTDGVSYAPYSYLYWPIYMNGAITTLSGPRWSRDIIDDIEKSTAFPSIKPNGNGGFHTGSITSTTLPSNMTESTVWATTPGWTTIDGHSYACQKMDSRFFTNKNWTCFAEFLRLPLPAGYSLTLVTRDQMGDYRDYVDLVRPCGDTTRKVVRDKSTRTNPWGGHLAWFEIEGCDNYLVHYMRIDLSRMTNLLGHQFGFVPYIFTGTNTQNDPYFSSDNADGSNPVYSVDSIANATTYNEIRLWRNKFLFLPDDTLAIGLLVPN